MEQLEVDVARARQEAGKKSESAEQERLEVRAVCYSS